MADNRCGTGYCSLRLESWQVVKCPYKNEDGTCPYQNGNRVEDGQRTIDLFCCKSGCRMGAAWYAQWDGTCAYQDVTETIYDGEELD